MHDETEAPRRRLLWAGRIAPRVGLHPHDPHHGDGTDVAAEAARERHAVADGLALADVAVERFGALEGLAWVTFQWRLAPDDLEVMTRDVAASVLQRRCTAAEQAVWAAAERAGVASFEEFRWFLETDAPAIVDALRGAA